MTTLKDLEKTVEDIRLAASLLARQVAGCGKLQYTPYGKCPECEYANICETLEEAK